MSTPVKSRRLPKDPAIDYQVKPNPSSPLSPEGAYGSSLSSTKDVREFHMFYECVSDKRSTVDKM